MKACLSILEDHSYLISIVSNGYGEGSNPSLRIIVPSSLESQVCFADQTICFELGFYDPNLGSCLSDNQSHLYRKDRWRLLFIFVIIQVKRETVMTTWQLH